MVVALDLFLFENTKCLRTEIVHCFLVFSDPKGMDWIRQYVCGKLD
jgi:hypothetical protein